MAGPRQLQIEDLLLDTGNPRIGSASSQRDALQKIIDDQGEKLYELASSISAEGMSPIDRLLVVKEKGGSSARFVALEGNRRVAALRILATPSILNGLQLKPALHKRFDELAKAFDRATVEPVDCFEVDSREDATSWLYLRHTGENEGRGVVGWSGVASSRFRGSDPALQALELVRQYGNLTEHQKSVIGDRFPITTLDRLLSARHVRERIGVAVKDGKLETGLPAREVIKPLRRMVLDLAEKKINVSALKNREQQKAYLDKFGPDSWPDLTKVDGMRPVETISGTEFKGRAPGTKRTRSAAGADPAERKTVVPKAAKLNVQDNKTAEIFKELRTLKLDDHPHAIAVLLRVFLELSIDSYMDRHRLPKTFKHPRDNRTLDKSLKDKLKDVIAHLTSQGADKRDFAGMERALTLSHSPLNIDLLHGYVHNLFVTPKRRDLTAAWDESHPFFEKVWP
jgi:hypothetical protein